MEGFTMNIKIRRQKTEDRKQTSCLHSLKPAATHCSLLIAHCFLSLTLTLTLLLVFASLGWTGGGAGIYDRSNEMVLISEGKFLMGSRADDGRVGVDLGVDEIP